MTKLIKQGFYNLFMMIYTMVVCSTILFGFALKESMPVIIPIGWAFLIALIVVTAPFFEKLIKNKGNK